MSKTDLVTFSETAAQIFEVPPGPQLTWSKMRDLLHVDDRERARLAFEESLANRSDYDIEYRLISSNGSPRWVSAKGRAQYRRRRQPLRNVRGCSRHHGEKSYGSSAPRADRSAEHT